MKLLMKFATDFDFTLFFILLNVWACYSCGS